MVNIKKCGSCKQLLPPEAFWKRSNRPDGLQYQCKECCKRVRRAWYKRGEGKIYVHNWRLKDWPKYLASVRKYHATPSGYFTALKNGKNKKGKIQMTREEFLRWNSSQPRECFYCGIPEEFVKVLPIFGIMGGLKNNRLTLDRKDSTKFYSLDNIALACWVCNKVKSNIFLAEEFKEIALKYIKPKWNEALAALNG